jgi:ribonucleoside-diphosphate reductase alpha chain
MDNETAELIGYAIGNGCVTKSGRLEITVGGHEEGIALGISRRINQLAETVGRSSSRIVDVRPMPLESSKKKYPGHYVYRVGSGNKNLVSYLNDYALLNKGSQFKQLTDNFLDTRSDYLLACLRGLFTADGSAGRSRVSFATTSRELAEQVRFILNVNGIDSDLFTEGSRPRRKQGYTVRVSANSWKVFEEKVGFLPESLKTLRLRAMIARGKGSNGRTTRPTQHILFRLEGSAAQQSLLLPC